MLRGGKGNLSCTDILYCVLTSLDLDCSIMKLVSLLLSLLDTIENTTEASTKIEEEIMEFFLSMEFLSFLLFSFEFSKNSTYLS